MRRGVRSDNPVRRRLFADHNPGDDASLDNFANVLQESFAREDEEIMKKYNFDFKNDVPLIGVWEWRRVNDENWVGVNCDSKISIQDENESTPREKTSSAALVVRKRKSDGDTPSNEKGARRRISF